MKRLSEIPGLDIYADNAKNLGKAHDLVIDLQKGEVARITLQPIESLLGASQQWIKENTVSYKNVTSVGDIIVVSSKPRTEDPMDETPASTQARPAKYSFVANRAPMYK
ncbi:PRC-barrel domain-containing protein [Candidatus Micrarchaeota archaeon]|nr:PRC-barrel domain-containing protein [Candidatus Micrarchaeota archaeon]